MSMSNEEDAGANYLAALKHSSTPQPSGAAPVRARDIAHSGESRSGEPHYEPRSGERHSNEARSAIPALSTTSSRPEQRKSPRYKCQGSARMQQPDNVASTWATFSDISMHGCYVESADPFGAGTLLELKLEANGFRIDAVGQVRITYPGLGMGISFSRISELDRERLRELVRSISRPSVILGARAQEPLQTTPPDTPAITNPSAAVQAMVKFFEHRHMMGREEFLAILRKSR